MQAPMHTKSLASLRMGIVRQQLGEAHEQETARQGESAATAGGALAIISAMKEKSQAIGSGAAEVLKKEADGRRCSGQHCPICLLSRAGNACLALTTSYALSGIVCCGCEECLLCTMTAVKEAGETVA